MKYSLNKAWYIRVIHTKYLPKRINGLTLFPFIFINSNNVGYMNQSYYDRLINHELIHIKQQIELLVLPFYLWYLLEWFFNLFIFNFNAEYAYRYISFEIEAYKNDNDLNYLNKRKMFGFLRK